jgi:hypothetical protein
LEEVKPLNNTYPIIVIGMHRSGTSLLSNLLDKASVFMGSDLDIHHESNFFIDINRWLMEQCGGRWDTPASIEYLFSDDDVFNIFKTHITGLLQSRYAREYLGKKYGEGHRSLLDLDFPWGWKDPRTTITLPLWLSIFPEAKVIHVLRHGVDVASSLKNREEANLLGRQSMHKKALTKGDNLLVKGIRRCTYDRFARLHYRSNQKMPPRKDQSLRCLSLDKAFELWREYVEVAFKLEQEYPQQIYTIKYEDLLCDPVAHFEKILRFIDLPHAEILSDEQSFSVNPSRAYAYRNTEELASFAEEVSSTLCKYGYCESAQVSKRIE